ncbi:MAG: glycosyltransferase [Acidimicrobiales bacterium]
MFWISQTLPRSEVVQIMSHATVFVCPSLYEPFGLVNVEAMACGAPVVATATGGIPEIIVDGVTGYLVPVASIEGANPARDPDRLARGLASSINELVNDPTRARHFGQLGRERVIEHFSWPAIASATAELYECVLADRR